MNKEVLIQISTCAKWYKKWHSLVWEPYESMTLDELAAKILHEINVEQDDFTNRMKVKYSNSNIGAKPFTKVVFYA